MSKWYDFTTCYPACSLIRFAAQRPIARLDRIAYLRQCLLRHERDSGVIPATRTRVFHQHQERNLTLRKQSGPLMVIPYLLQACSSRTGSYSSHHIVTNHINDRFARSAAAQLPTLLLPDKDADGLCSGLILYRTLLALGLHADRLSVHFVSKGSNIHTAGERARIARYTPRYVIVCDQGSRPGPPIVDAPGVRTLIVDHHLSDEFPDGAEVLSAAHHEPVATSSTLTYLLCRPLVSAAAPAVLLKELEYLCVIGTMGDLGTAFRWEAPFPDMRACLKEWTKKVLGEAVSLLNAREYLRSVYWGKRLTGTHDCSTPYSKV